MMSPPLSGTSGLSCSLIPLFYISSLVLLPSFVSLSYPFLVLAHSPDFFHMALVLEILNCYKSFLTRTLMCGLLFYLLSIIYTHARAHAGTRTHTHTHVEHGHIV